VNERRLAVDPGFLARCLLRSFEWSDRPNGSSFKSAQQAQRDELRSREDEPQWRSLSNTNDSPILALSRSGHIRPPMSAVRVQRTRLRRKLPSMTRIALASLLAGCVAVAGRGRVARRGAIRWRDA